MKNSLSEHSVFILKTSFFFHNIDKLPDVKIIARLIDELIKYSNKVDFYEKMNNESGRQADLLFYQFNSVKSLNFQLFTENEKLKDEIARAEQNKTAAVALVRAKYEKIITDLKADFYDQSPRSRKIG